MREKEAAMERERKIFEEDPIPSAVAQLAVPTVITQLINVIYNFADTWFVGRTGSPAMVAALSVTMPLYVIMAGLANLFGVGGSSVISRCLGRREPEKARRAFAFSFYGGLLIALLYAVMMLEFREPLIDLVGGTEESYPYIDDYMFWTMVVGAVPTVGNVLCGHLARSIGDAKEAGIGMSLGGILNIALDPLFMFVILPQGMEVRGAAVATLLSNVCACLYFAFYFRKKKGHPVYSFSLSDAKGEGVRKDVLLIGTPAALSTIMAMLSNIAANALVKEYGNEAVAGMGIAKKINMIAFNTTMGMTQGILPLLAYNYGSGNFKRLWKAFRFTGAAAFVFCLICLGVFRGLSEELVRFFLDEEASVGYGASFLRVIALGTPLSVVSYLVNTVFQACGRKASSLALSVLRKGVLDVILMHVLKAEIGIMGVPWATPAAELISAVLAAFLVWRLSASLKKEAAQ